MSSVKKLVFSIPESGEVYMVLVQSLSSRFYTQKEMSIWEKQATWTQCGDELLCFTSNLSPYNKLRAENWQNPTLEPHRQNKKSFR